MKPRARRVTMGAAAILAVLLAVLVVANWATVRDHVEAWHFQLTNKTWTFEPRRLNDESFEDHLQVLSTYSNRSVILSFQTFSEGWPSAMFRDFTAADVLRECRESGCRILEQRFPRRAYVVTNDGCRGITTSSSEGEDAGISLEITPTISPGTERP